MADFSGKFVLRLTEELHRKLSAEASRQGVSLNQLCSQFLDRGLTRPERTPLEDRYAPLKAQLKKKFGDHLLGVFLFGSQVTEQATKDSDFDFLIVLDRRARLERSLYRWWDESVKSPDREEWNPQFVHLPETPQQAGGLWLEVALTHRVLWEKGGKVSSFLKALKNLMERDEVRRHIFQGQPYWVWMTGKAA